MSSTIELAPEEARERLILKAKERKERIAANHEKALGIIQSGDKSFDGGNFVEASKIYSEAVQLWNTNVNLHVKRATTYVKCKEYEQAATAATRALYMDPSNIEARYQRGLARLEQHKAALAVIDFFTVLQVDPTHSRAIDVFEKARKELNRRKGQTKLSKDTDVDLLDPEIDEDPIEEVDLSDSEDFKMVGNGVACRHYNKKPAGCREGLNCKWMHAPDDKSVRDTTGRNVCIYYLFDYCRFGEKCFYLHDKEWLPPNGWWDDPYQVSKMEEVVEMAERREKMQQQRKERKKRSSRQSKKKRRGKKQNPVTSSSRIPARVMAAMNSIDYELDNEFDDSDYDPATSSSRIPARVMAAMNSIDYELDNDSDDSDYDYRMLNFGFSQGDIEELICQGVKPWDDDAWDVLHALSSY